MRTAERPVFYLFANHPYSNSTLQNFALTSMCDQKAFGQSNFIVLLLLAVVLRFQQVIALLKALCLMLRSLKLPSINESEPIEISGPGLNGGQITTEDMSGIVIVNAWASWCPPCREEWPIFVEVQKQYPALICLG
jgi:hypothetical protein